MQPREFVAQWRQSVQEYVLANPTESYESIARKFKITSGYVSHIARMGGIRRVTVITSVPTEAGE